MSAPTEPTPHAELVARVRALASLESDQLADELAAALTFDLALVATDDLIGALARRVDCLLVASLRDLSSTEEARRVDWRGSPVVALGLAVLARERLSEHCLTRSTPDDS